jgi:hypothetical protein
LNAFFKVMQVHFNATLARGNVSSLRGISCQKTDYQCFRQKSPQCLVKRRHFTNTPPLNIPTAITDVTGSGFAVNVLKSCSSTVGIGLSWRCRTWESF